MNKPIFLIVSNYLDGETREILGYVTTEDEACQCVKELSETLHKDETFRYSYTHVGKY